MPFNLAHTGKQNRRVEQRVHAGGELVLSFEDPLHREIRVELVDYSRSGFRAVHQYSALTTGQLVQYQRWGVRAKAKVVWNRILGDKVETGFLTV